ncbi:FMN-binding negative transcriptional regulator [Microbacterium sp. No. 7]|uniref:FMN-binding negative transcriptional regulator n=1 Tax=Microbacterium sp. No. 7 TaxID=1714373 RepID=UPI0006D298A6|nr:FMN-binding negative transcriptional regulator [Microbacterium sp. No. 7]ALJ20411.1 transcriptional regulator [Microbacterium sp. No. 7]
MRHNPDYELTELAAVRALVRENPWVTMVSHVPGAGLVASHCAVLLEEDAEGLVLLGHLGRPDERLHGLGRHEVMLIAYGPQGYVSPGWYRTAPAVPTWNFVAAHLHGTPEILSDADNLEVLDRLVRRLEEPMPEPYLMGRTCENAEYAGRIAHGTVGFRVAVSRFEAKEKMSQDKPAEVVDRVIEALRRPGPYQNDALAHRMALVRDRRARGLRGEA